MARTLSLIIRNLLFTVVVPGLAALLVVLGQAWLFLSPPLLAYAGAMAVFFHLFVTGYEERVLRRRFGSTYAEYRRMVPRWIPRAPRHGQGTGIPAGGLASRQDRPNTTNSEVSR